MNGEIIAQAKLKKGNMEYVVKNNNGTYSNLSITTNGYASELLVEGWDNNEKQAMTNFAHRILADCDWYRLNS